MKNKSYLLVRRRPMHVGISMNFSYIFFHCLWIFYTDILLVMQVNYLKFLIKLAWYKNLFSRFSIQIVSKLNKKIIGKFMPSFFVYIDGISWFLIFNIAFFRNWIESFGIYILFFHPNLHSYLFWTIFYMEFWEHVQLWCSSIVFMKLNPMCALWMH